MGIRARYDNSIINNIKHNLKKIIHMPRNHGREKELIQRDKVEFKLLTTLGTDEVFRWLPDCHKQRNFLYIRNYRIAIRTVDESFSHMNQQVKEETEELRRHAKKVIAIAKTVRETAKTISKIKVPEDVLNNYIKTLNGYADSLSSYNSISKNIIPLNTYAPWNPPSTPIALLPLKTYLGNIKFREDIFIGTSLPHSLISLYATINQVSESHAIKILADEFSISDDIFSELDIDYRTRWYFDNVANAPIPGAHYLFKGLNRTYIGAMQQITEDEKDILLPQSCWKKQGDEFFATFNIPFPKPYPLYNLFYIENNRQATIFLSDSIKIADANTCTNNDVWTSWYGEQEAVEHVDWQRLKNRTVYYILTNHSGFEKSEIYETALAVYKQLKNIVKTISFINCWPSPMTTNKFSFDDNFTRVFNPQEFLQEARFVLKAQIDISNKLLDEIYPLKTIADIGDIKDVKYLLSPVITEDSLTLLSGTPETGNTWLALSIAYSLSMGLPTFNKWECTDPRKVLYISSKMSDNSLKRRLQVISKIYSSNEENKSHSKNFMWKSVCPDMLNLSNKDDRRKIEELLNEAKLQTPHDAKISLLVLDNLNSLLEPDDSSKSKKDISMWLKKLKNQGCSVLLVNNIKETQKDFPIKSNIIDNIICLQKKGASSLSKFAMSIMIKKGYEIYGILKIPFIIELNPKSKNPAWKRIATMTKEEENQYIIAFNSLMTESEIAEYLGLSVPTIKKRRSELGLTKTRLKNSKKEQDEMKLLLDKGTSIDSKSKKSMSDIDTYKGTRKSNKRTIPLIPDIKKNIPPDKKV